MAKKPKTPVTIRTYEKNGYTVEESKEIRIGYSSVCVFYRNEIDTDGTEFPRVVIQVSNSGVYSEIDTTHLPYPEQCKELAAFFTSIANMYEKRT